ncbi:hypothetical protein [Mammaliicoccus sciuri]
MFTEYGPDNVVVLHAIDDIMFTEYGPDNVVVLHAIDDIMFTEEYQVKY